MPTHCISRLCALLLLALPAAAQDTPARPGAWRLADASSPYLREHAGSDIEWWPWGEAAFAHAKELDRPVFLSIGYSACHWCHRMERDTFASPEVVRRLNENFVCVLVDREEQPDVDSRFMHALVLMTGGGGWPATLFLTPEGKPFFGGTYYPAESGPMGVGLPDVLDRIHELWTTDRATVTQATTELHDVLGRDALSDAGTDAAPELRTLLDEATTTLTGSLDSTWGGTQDSPKFPPILLLDFLLRQHLRTGVSVQDLITVSLDAMSSAGLYDHVGGGFFRYCVDPHWETPHFEKMLADTAQLAPLYADASVALGEPRWADVARDALGWVVREMRLPNGLYAGSLDADSLPVEPPAAGPDGAATEPPHAEEGRFYLWTPAQLERVLGDHDGKAFAQIYHVTQEGNVLDMGQPTGLSLPRPMRNVPALTTTPGADVKPGEPFLQWRTHALGLLRADRDQRPRPARDDKAVAAWNGLLLSGFARSGARLDDEPLRSQAVSLAAAIRAGLLLRDEPLPRVAHQNYLGQPSGRGNLLDTAAVGLGLLDAHEATGQPELLLDAFGLARSLLARFEDPDGGFWSAEASDARLPNRGRDVWDSSMPAGASLAVQLLLRLAPLDDSGDLQTAARRTLARLTPLAATGPDGFPALLTAADMANGPLAEIVLDGAAEPRAALARAVHARVLPAALLLPDARGLAAAIAAQRKAALAASQAPLFAEDPSLLAGRAAPDGEARAWVCVQRACLLPVARPEELSKQLDGVVPRAPKAAEPVPATPAPGN
ncbi:MAG TPA: thioredoxin domain-containing protein [Planctomycetota bacterium]|nr:thioredoxin domain-containing protein [Planctomycetota bacterium]